jgi:hypothetical protein
MKEEKKERIKQLIKKLSELSEEQRQSIVAKLGIRNPEGHLLSDRNQSLLYLQAMGSPLSVVAGYKQWQKSGRQVTKGQSGYIIAIPSGAKKSEAQDPESEEDIFFLWKAVFDISQTEEITEQSKGKAA